MRFNEDIAISTSRVLLVPYDAHHVLRYHEWMKDPAIQEATASEPLTLDEEYENQQSWRSSHDKLTFIVCRGVDASNGVDAENVAHESKSRGGDPCGAAAGGRVYAGEVDTPDRMVGDVNLFLTPWEGEDDDVVVVVVDGEAVVSVPKLKRDPAVGYCNGEVDIMIADRNHRGKGLGISAVSTLLCFIRQHLKSILAEYSTAQGARRPYELKDLVAKISSANVSSIALFTKLGFKQRGEVNYFGEIEMVLENFGRATSSGADKSGDIADVHHQELVYDRSRLKAQFT